MAATASSAVLLDLRGLSAYSSLGVTTLRGYINRRKNPLPHYRLDGKILVKRDAFDRWLESHKVDDATVRRNVDALIEGLI
jgi:hypothetical protein